MSRFPGAGSARRSSSSRISDRRAHQITILGGGGHGDVELGVEAHVSPARSAADPSRARDTLDRLEVRASAATRPRPAQPAVRGSGGSRAAPPAPAAACSSRRDQLLHHLRVLVGRQNERAAEPAATRLDEPLRLEETQRVLDGRTADAEHAGKLALGRQRFARSHEPQRNMTSNLLRDVLVRAQLAGCGRTRPAAGSVVTRARDRGDDAITDRGFATCSRKASKSLSRGRPATTLRRLSVSASSASGSTPSASSSCR